MPFDFLKPKAKQTLHKYPTDFLLGDMLVKAGVITQAQLDEGVKLAGSKHLHVGQMLIMAGYISPRDLQAAVDAQSLLRDRAVDTAVAMRCLKIACKTGMSFADVVRDQDQGAASATTNKLGELLLEAGLIDRDQFGKSMQRSLSTGLPLGRMLVLNGALAEPVLTLALDLQVRVRDGMTSRQEAIETLAAAGGTFANVSQEETVRLSNVLVQPPRKKGIRIGELLVLAGLLAETDVMNALELGLMQGMRIGEVLIGQGYLSPELLDAGLELQRMVDADSLQPSEAAELLAKIRSTGMSVQDAVREAEEAKPEQPKATISFEKLLILARVVNEDEIENALAEAAKSPQILSRVLNLAGYIDEDTMAAVLQSFTMMTNGFLSQDDTVIALDYCLHKPTETRGTFGEALSELGWNAMLPLQMQAANSVDISQVRLAAMQPPGQEGSTLGALVDMESEAQAEIDAESNNGQSESWAESGSSELEGASAASLLDELQMATAYDDESTADLTSAVAASGMLIEEDSAPVSAATLALFGAELAGSGAPTAALDEEEITGERDVFLKEDELSEFTIEPPVYSESESAGESLPSAQSLIDYAEPEVMLETLDEAVAADPLFAESQELPEPVEAEPAAPQPVGAEEPAMAAPEVELPPLSAVLEPPAEVELGTAQQMRGLSGLFDEQGASDEALPVEVTGEPESQEVVSAFEEVSSSVSASSLVADLEAASGVEPLAADYPAGLGEAAAETSMSDAAGQGRPTAADLVAQLEAASDAAPEPTIAELLSSSKERLKNSQEEAAASPADSMKSLFGLDSDDPAANKALEPPSAEEILRSISEEASSADSERSDDDQRVVPRRDSLRNKLISSGEWATLDNDSMSLRDLFSTGERLTDEVISTPPVVEESNKSAQDLMEELLARAGAEQTAKKDDQSKKGSDEKSLREEAQKEASRREAEQAERRAAIETAKREAEELARREAEEKAKLEAEEKAKLEAEEQTKLEAEEKAKFEAAEKAKLEAEEKARLEAEEKARLEAEEKARLEAEEKARLEAEEKARLEAEEKARFEAEEKARFEAEEKARFEAEEKAKLDAEEKAKLDAEEKGKREAEEQARKQAEEAAQKLEQEKLAAEEGARRLAEEAARREAEEEAAKRAAAANKAEVASAAASKAPSFWAEAASQANIPIEKVTENETAPAGAAPAIAAGAALAPAASSAPPQDEPAAAAKEGDAASLPKPTRTKNAELLAAATKAAKAVEQAEAGSQTKEQLKLALVTSLSRLAESYYEQGDYAEAQGLYERILMLRQSQLGPRHESLGADLTNLAGVLCVQGKFAQAEPFVKRVVTIIEGIQPLEELKLADSLNTLAGILFQQGKFSECEPLLERALRLRQSKLGAEHPHVADNLRDFAKLLKKLGRDADAEKMYAEAKAIIAKRPKQQQPVA